MFLGLSASINQSLNIDLLSACLGSCNAIVDSLHGHVTQLNDSAS